MPSKEFMSRSKAAQRKQAASGCFCLLLLGFASSTSASTHATRTSTGSSSKLQHSVPRVLLSRPGSSSSRRHLQEISAGPGLAGVPDWALGTTTSSSSSSSAPSFGTTFLSSQESAAPESESACPTASKRLAAATSPSSLRTPVSLSWDGSAIAWGGPYAPHKDAAGGSVGAVFWLDAEGWAHIFKLAATAAANNTDAGGHTWSLVAQLPYAGYGTPGSCRPLVDVSDRFAAVAYVSGPELKADVVFHNAPAAAAGRKWAEFVKVCTLSKLLVAIGTDGNSKAAVTVPDPSADQLANIAIRQPTGTLSLRVLVTTRNPGASYVWTLSRRGEQACPTSPKNLLESINPNYNALPLLTADVTGDGLVTAEWAADLPAELRALCCCRQLGAWCPAELLAPQLSAHRTADLFAVALHIAARGCRNLSHGYPFDDDSQEAPAENIYYMLTAHKFGSVAQLPASAIEALLWLAMRLHSRINNLNTAETWNHFMTEFCQLPAAVQVPTAKLVELVQQVLQKPVWPLTLRANPFLDLLAEKELTAEQALGLARRTALTLVTSSSE
ncbi:hypothetical protein OEZ85_000785 [Tetradesmus obliquus]|uniref:Uncharacterized protein n=1 Tax=Tetradesmus obliquus TaxID=3088 RepID=A0ABY8UK15_TETOB|nr:hypothetical protein OEZ85_000785 [Tetradesmus obliquus]